MTIATPTFKDLVDFVMKNKGIKTFMGYSDERVIAMLKEGLDNESFFYEIDPDDGHITGFILAVIDNKQKVIFVTENLAMSITCLKRFAMKAKDKWPGYSLRAKRHGQYRRFNTPKLYNKLNI